VIHVREYAELRGNPSLAETLAAVWSPGPYARIAHRLSGIDGWSAYLLLLPIALGIWRFRGPARWLWSLIALGQPLFVVMFMAGRGSTLPRYVSTAFPALILLTVAGIDQLVLVLLQSPRWRARLAFVPVGWACIVTALLTRELIEQHWVLPRDVSWQRLSQELSRVKGQKVVFFRVGVNAQMPAYYSRHDPSVAYVVPVPLGDNRANRSLTTRSVIASGVRNHPDARCFVFVKDARPGKRGKDVYESVFTPQMEQLGYVESFNLTSGSVKNKSHDYYAAYGFCRS
jgi:hypothetical protein